MTILVTGATGTVGRHVVDQLVKRGADVRALVRDPAKARFPAGVAVAQGDLLDVDSLRSAFSGVSTLFLLNAVAPDEFTQALVALNVAREAGIARIVYLSVIHSDVYVNVPHFAGKFAVERMIEQMGLNATILRPAYFMTNDLTIKDVVLGYSIYPMPIGAKGLAMIDVSDIGEIAAIELIRREQSAVPLPLDRINLVGPDTLTGADAAAIWSDVLGRTIAYGGDNARQFETNLRQIMPSWMAFDMRLMAERFLTDGMVPEAGDVARLTALLGRPLRSYRDFVADIATAA
ncbi:NmrA/HSCARG family protein [Bradyrhizobium sp. SZCCHNR1093]|uniref:SDR family oxidoreductase n=1 Tax=Bradyrhizobium sp. SZCCHNR1093 TaxID=3057368 RepID=UPI0028EFDB8A|nr:NmrA/HSCARG family protein [Bradyrhizobium sp. SZCCHNR1093]